MQSYKVLVGMDATIFETGAAPSYISHLPMCIAVYINTTGRGVLLLQITALEKILTTVSHQHLEESRSKSSKYI